MLQVFGARVPSIQANSPHGEGSVLTSYANDDKSFWNSFRRELVKEGFSSKVLRKHKPLIQEYVRELGNRGALDEVSIHEAEQDTIDKEQDPNAARSEPEDCSVKSDPSGEHRTDLYIHVGQKEVGIDAVSTPHNTYATVIGEANYPSSSRSQDDIGESRFQEERFHEIQTPKATDFDENEHEDLTHHGIGLNEADNSPAGSECNLERDSKSQHSNPEHQPRVHKRNIGQDSDDTYDPTFPPKPASVELEIEVSLPKNFNASGSFTQDPGVTRIVDELNFISPLIRGEIVPSCLKLK